VLTIRLHFLEQASKLCGDLFGMRGRFLLSRPKAKDIAIFGKDCDKAAGFQPGKAEPYGGLSIGSDRRQHGNLYTTVGDSQSVLHQPGQESEESVLLGQAGIDTK
jgi:hypothetical protein